MSFIPREVSPEQIIKGRVFDVAVPFTKGRPFSFVEETDNGSGLFRIVKKDYGLEAKIVGGKTKAQVLKIVTEIKLRPALVILRDNLNQHTEYPYTIVLPIGTITEEQKKRKLFKRMLETNDVDQIHYIGNDSYITINDPYRVFKTTLFERSCPITIGDKEVSTILVKLGKCLDMDRIARCDECESNCDNCELKLSVNT